MIEKKLSFITMGDVHRNDEFPFLSGKITAHNSESDNSIELMCARLLYAGGNDTFTDWLREA